MGKGPTRPFAKKDKRWAPFRGIPGLQAMTAVRKKARVLSARMPPELQPVAELLMSAMVNGHPVVCRAALFKLITMYRETLPKDRTKKPDGVSEFQRVHRTSLPPLEKALDDEVERLEEEAPDLEPEEEDDGELPAMGGGVMDFSDVLDPPG